MRWRKTASRAFSRPVVALPADPAAATKWHTIAKASGVSDVWLEDFMQRHQGRRARRRRERRAALARACAKPAGGRSPAQPCGRDRHASAGRSARHHGFRVPSSDDLHHAGRSPCAALKDSVLQEQVARPGTPTSWTPRASPCSIARSTSLIKNFDCGSKVKSAGNDGLRKNQHRSKISAGTIVENLKHGISRNSSFPGHRHCLGCRDQSYRRQNIVCELHDLSGTGLVPGDHHCRPP